MPSLTIDDFRPFSVTCELRYKNAYLIYDRTGQVLEELRNSFPSIAVSTASPAQTAPVEREQWNSLEWLQQKIRIVRKEADGVLHGGK